MGSSTCRFYYFGKERSALLALLQQAFQEESNGKKAKFLYIYICVCVCIHNIFIFFFCHTRVKKDIEQLLCQ